LTPGQTNPKEHTQITTFLVLSFKKYFYVIFNEQSGLYYGKSQCRTVVPHCCKGDAASQWEMAILGVSELRNP